VFAAGVVGANNAMLASMYVAAKARYPRIVAPVSATLMPLVDFTAGLVLLPILFFTQKPHAHFSPLPFFGAIVGTLLLAIGIGTLLSAVTIFVRDVKNLLPFALQLGILVTPVAYPVTRLPDVLRTANPMATYVRGIRASLLRTDPPGAGDWFLALVVSVLVGALGVMYFERVQARFPDVA
jgi:lipopolysaccharide transport system permease protein